MRNDLLKQLGQEKSLEAAEAVLSGNFKVVRKFKQDFFLNFVKINGEKYKFSKPFFFKIVVLGPKKTQKVKYYG